MEQKNRVSEVMNSLEGIQMSKAPRDGFPKIQQKLAEQRNQQRPIHDWKKIAAVVVLVICSNVWAVTNYLSHDGLVSGKSKGYPQLVSDFNMYGNE